MTIRLLRALAAAGALIAAASAAHAGVYTATATATSGTRNTSGLTDNQSLTQNTAANVAAASSQSETYIGAGALTGTSANSAGNSTATSSAGPGLIRLYAAAHGQTVSSRAPSAGTGGSSAYGSLDDHFSIAALNCALCTAGSVGTMTFTLAFHGLATGGGSYQSDIPPGNGGGGGFSHHAGWSTTFGLNAGYVPNAQIDSSATGTASGWFNETESGQSVGSTGLGLGQHSFTVAFVFGQDINLQWLAYADASGGAASTGNEASFSAMADGMADFNHTFAWAGIGTVLDSAGQVVSAFTALNSDGVDFARSFATTGTQVPEPATPALVLAALAAVGALGRRRSAAARA